MNMKELTEYFASNIKKCNTKPVEDTSPETSSRMNKTKNTTGDLNNGENSAKVKTRNVKRKKRKRKPSDPVVNNMTEIFSNSLSILSPININKTSINKNINTKTTSEENGNIDVQHTSSSFKGCDSLDKIDKTVINHKKDFNKDNKLNQQLPQNHTLSSKDYVETTVAIELGSSNVVGDYAMPKTNSDSQNSTLDSKGKGSLSDSQIVKSQKNAFQLMMESRNKVIGQNSPGKVNVEDNIVDKDIKKKLLARKSILQDWSEKRGAYKRKREEDTDEIISQKLNRRKRRFKKLLKVDEPVLANEESADIIVKKRRIQVIDSDSQSGDSINFLDTPQQKLSGSLLDIVSDVVEENAQDGLLNNTKTEMKTKDTKQSVLSFFGILSTPKNYDRDDEKKDEGTSKMLRLRRKRENHLETKLIVETNNGASKTTEQRTSSKKDKMSKLKRKETQSQTYNEESTLSNQPILAQQSNIPKTKKKRLKDLDKKHALEDTVKTPGKDSKIVYDNDDSLTPRSLKTWKMKIKLNMEPETTEKKNKNDTESENKPHASNVELTADELSGRGKTRNFRISKQSIFDQEVVLSDSEDEFVEKRKLRNRSALVKKKLDEIVLSDDENDSEDMPVVKKPVKVAPIFLKVTPKPKLATEVLEARKQFLMSGIPNSLKKTIEKQQSMEERTYEIFPGISHVQQRCKSTLWNLSSPQLNLPICSPIKLKQPAICSGITTNQISDKLDIQTEIQKVDKLKTLLNRIKTDNPNYPVYKSFRLIYEKSGKTQQKAKNILTNRQKEIGLDNSIEIIEPGVEEFDLIEQAMWTEKYKPKCSGDIIGNSEGIKTLKRWLENWFNFSKEINARKKKCEDSTSESEFDITDCDSRDSTRLPGNTFVVGGPCGCGKSTAIYAICEELGFNVIELNASSKRTGKRLLQELQEATQSHQVRKNEHGMQSFLQKPKPKENTKDQQKQKKMCVLLIEDIDIVFEQDDGFISALAQLVTTSKRPIIMTTTDSASNFAQKFINQHDFISFSSLSSQTLATWLQILCLVEGLLVDRDDMGCLLEFNKGDVRKTMLQLQYWVQSGGQIFREKIPLKTDSKHSSLQEKVADDEVLPSYVKDQNKKDTNPFIHSNCLASFEIFRGCRSYSIPYNFNLGLFWWNIPNILNIPDFSSYRLYRFAENKPEMNEITIKNKNHKLTQIDKIKLLSIERLYDSLALTDVMFRKIKCSDGSEPVIKNYSDDLKDGLELNECMETYDGYSEFVHEVTHVLVNGYVEDYKSIETEVSIINMALPGRSERRWRSKHHVCEDVFQEALTHLSYTDRKSVALDYLPALRNISRSERCRATNNNKRGNRFRNYLRDLNINCNDNTLKLACNILIDE